MKKALLITISVILIAVIAVSGEKLYQGLHDYQVIDEYYDTVKQYVVEPEVSVAPTKEPTPEPQVTAESVSEMETSLIEENLEPVETVPISIDFEALLSDCPDTIGWLYSLDGEINLPVVQGEDNQYYLKHLPNGEYSSGGSLFLDYLNESDFSDEASFIYGHNMKNGTMLQPILEYRKQTYYDTYPVMYLLTPEKNYKVELFAGILTGIESEVYTFNFDSPETKQAFINELVSQSSFVPRRIPEAGERLLCLSTCAYDYDNARYVVLGALTEIG